MVKKALLALAAGVLGVLPADASGHILYDNGNLSHQRHARDINFYNGGGGTTWDSARWAQLEWHNRMGGSLRFPTTSHDSSFVHVVEASYGNTGWAGQTWNAGYHAGHAHVQLNVSYNLYAWQWNAVACHEIGHSVGMAHSSDASDCMENQGRFTQSIAQSHVDQLRGAWNAAGH